MFAGPIFAFKPLSARPGLIEMRSYSLGLFAVLAPSEKSGKVAVYKVI